MNCSTFNRTIKETSNFTTEHNITTFNTTLQNSCTSNMTNKTQICMSIGEMLYIMAYGFVIILVISGNVLVLLKIKPFENRRHRTNIELLISYLSVFDLLTAIFLITDLYDNMTLFVKWPFGSIGCILIYPLYHISLNMSVCILTIMSVDRFRSIVTPLHKKFTRVMIHVAVFISIIVSVVAQGYQFLHLKVKTTNEFSSCHANKKAWSYAVLRVVNTIIRDLTFITVFTITSVVICKTVLSNNSILDLYYTDRKKKETRNVMTMLLVMEGVFTLLVVPYDVYDCAMFISHLMGDGIKFTETVYYIDRILSLMQMSNSFANCFIYAKMHRYVPPLRMSNTSRNEDHSNKRCSTAEYQNNDQRRGTNQEVIFTNSCYQQNDDLDN